MVNQGALAKGGLGGGTMDREGKHPPRLSCHLDSYGQHAPTPTPSAVPVAAKLVATIRAQKQCLGHLEADGDCRQVLWDGPHPIPLPPPAPTPLGKRQHTGRLTGCPFVDKPIWARSYRARTAVTHSLETLPMAAMCGCKAVVRKPCARRHAQYAPAEKKNRLRTGHFPARPLLGGPLVVVGGGGHESGRPPGHSGHIVPRQN